MLKQLKITNLGLIEEADIKFQDGLTVITGETGSGKSLIIDSIQLLFGIKGGAYQVRSEETQLVVEGVFQLSLPLAKLVFENISSKYKDPIDSTVLRIQRSIDVNGKNLCFLNGKKIGLKMLTSTGSVLADVYGQGSYSTIFNSSEHLPILDSYAGLTSVVEDVRGDITYFQNLVKRIIKLEENNEDKKNNRLQMMEELDEIERVELQIGEEDILKKEMLILLNSEKLSEMAINSYADIKSNEIDHSSVQDKITKIMQIIRENVDIDDKLKQPLDVLENISYQIDELGVFFRLYDSQLENNSGRLIQIQDRLGIIDGIKRKYRKSVEEILIYATDIHSRVISIDSSQEALASLVSERDRLAIPLEASCLLISKGRRDAIKLFVEDVDRELTDIGMVGTRISVSMESSSNGNNIRLTDIGETEFSVNNNGIDCVEFLMQGALDEPTKPLSKIASGGEAARLMLAFKSVVNTMGMGKSFVLDEIDYGIGGRLGDKIGRKLAELSIGDQVICVTHLPQVAVFADHHLRLLKTKLDEKLVIRAEFVENTDRVNEVIEMFGNDSPRVAEIADDMLIESAKWKQGLNRTNISVLHMAS
jgi:DNA repair protein RecN (Recombination protein N)